MRTTIDVDDDLLKTLKQKSHRSGLPLKKVLNTALRRGLSAPDEPERARRYRCPVFSMGEPVSASIDLDKALRLADTLEDAELARKLELRK